MKSCRSAGEVVPLVGVYAFEQRNEVIVAYHVRARGEIKLGDELEAYKLVPTDKLKPWPFATGLAVARLAGSAKDRVTAASRGSHTISQSPP